MMEPLEARTVPLSGTRLVEASAGTGKTFTLTTLYLRIVMEQGLAADQILVVTFTKAAAAELRERIRARLREMEEALRVRLAGESSKERAQESVIVPLVEACFERGEPEQELERLRIALRNFDEAQISTIHGFCDRMLEENAFESGAIFDTELVKDAGLLREEVAEDFWSQRFYNAHAGFVRWLLKTSRAGSQRTPSLLTKFLGSVLEQPRIVLRPDALADENLEAVESTWSSARQDAAAVWEAERDAILQLLLDAAHDNVLNKSLYKPEKIESEWAERTDALLSEDGIGSKEDRHTARLFRTSVLILKTRKQRVGETPQHRFFDLCETWLAATADLEEAFENQWLALELEFLAYAETEIGARREESGTRTFGDLLLDLSQALDGPSGKRLERRIRGRFPAAMIDEFQDTDPVQYHIFNRIWGGGKASFFLIGDPKQAIYSFRGADIFTYMQAKRDTEDAQYTLDWNWRSDPSLIRAVNCVFERISSPFLFDAIAFHAAQAPTTSRECMDAEAGAALRFLVFGRDAEGRLWKKGRTREMATSATAADIARLLASGATLESKSGRAAPVEPADVAVLCRTGPQARAIRAALVRLGISSVMAGQESVFETEETLEFEWLLAAVADPGDLRALRAALCTRLLGANARTLFDLQRDPEAWEPWLERARDWQVAWNHAGPIGLLERVLSHGNARACLLARPDGERRLTNWLHLGELLQQSWQRGRPGPRALCAWLRNLRRNVRSRRALRDDDALIRLESDERAVKLVTLHGSKGLQYPIVYCPFLWDDRMLRSAEQTWTAFHDPERDDRLTLDIGRDAVHDRAVARATWEALAEDLRLLYVGLTRAEHRLVVIWGPVENAGSSALGLLLHPPSDLAAWRGTWDEDPMKRLRENFKALEDSDLRAELERLAAVSDGAIAVEVLAEATAPQPVAERAEGAALKAREVTRSLHSPWRISSFSGLVAGSELARADNHPRMLGFDHEDPADAQPLPSLPPEEELRVRLADFPAGAVPGTMIHQILEQIDFEDPEPETLAETVAAALARHGLAEHWAPSLCEALPEILATPLGGPLEDFALKDLPRSDRLDELEFTLSVAGPGSRPVSPAGLAEVFATHAVRAGVIDYAARASALGFAPLEGHLRGFVDLVFRRNGRFYLADYKSNRLGFVRSDYGPEAVEHAMLEHDYVLQYHLYTVALHRMLRSRLPGYDYESHMGGVYYLFLRGLGPEPPTDAGLFFDRPPAALVEALSERLGGDPNGRRGGRE